MKRHVNSGDRSPMVKLKALDGIINLQSGALPTHLQFRRFAGCPVCSLHLRSFVRRADEIKANLREVVIFHSPRGELQRYVSDLPFHMVPDPTKAIYRAFGVEEDRKALLSPRAWPAIAKSVLAVLPGIIKGTAAVPPLDPPGGRFGLPADFMIASGGTVTASLYGTHVDDSWSVEEALEFAAQASATSKPQEPASVGGETN